MIMLDIDVPNTCFDCPMLDNDGGYCHVIYDVNKNNALKTMTKERLPDCPILAEITPHIANTGEINMRFSNHEKLNDKINEYIKYRPKRVATQEEWEKLFENTKEPPY